MNGPPSVSVVIPNWNGEAHLRDCLDSLEQVDYPRHLLEVIVVDNGSVDESRAIVKTSYPDVRLIPLDANEGFAAASNVGAEAATSECVAFLNNDMRVDEQWLRGLAEKYDPADGYVCVAGVILDWDGTRVGFTRGWVNYLGFAGQDHYREPLDERLIEDGSELLFACGGSMLVEREVFLRLGGFDPAYFALFEDVDLGWRLWLSGYKVRLAGTSRVLHRHHATSSRQPFHRLAVLYERNALFTLIKNVDDSTLAPILATALLMLAKRAVDDTGSSRESFQFDVGDDAPTEVVDRNGLAPLHAVSELLDGLPALLERRRVVQSRRQRSDAEIFKLFTRPFVSISRDESYVEAGLNLRAMFGLDTVFTAQRATRALVVVDDPSERLEGIARELSAVTKTSVVSPGSSGEVLDELLAESDLVIAGATSKHAERIAGRSRGLLAVDLGAGERAPLAALVGRGDVFLSSRHGVEAPQAGRTVLVLDGEGADATIRELVERPWRWRPAGQPVTPPEDLQELLRVWREHYRRGNRTKRAATSIRRFLPLRLERALRARLGRPRLAGDGR